MTRMKNLAVTTSDLFNMDPRVLKIREGWNVRKDGPALEAHILFLMESIREIGVQEPLTVIKEENDDIFITNGHCRHTAIMRLIAQGVEIVSVPVRTEDKYASPGDHLLTMLTRNSGKPLETIEKAEVCRQLYAYQWSTEKIAKKSGLTEEYVKDLLGLTASPEGIQNLVKDGKVSASLAMETLKKDGPREAEAILTEAVEVAKASGKDKATKKHVAPVREAKAAKAGLPLKKKLNWNEHGPELRDLILAIKNSTGKKREDAIEKASAYLDENSLHDLEAAS